MTELLDLRSILDRFPATAGRDFRMARPEHASLAQVYLLDDRLVLRARPAIPGVTDALAAELALVDRVRPLLPARLPDPLPTADGRRFVLQGPALYTLHEALPGRIARPWQQLGSAPGPARRELVALLRRLHDATRGRLPGGEASWLAVELATRLPIVRSRLSPGALAAVEAALGRVAAAYPDAPDRAFVHGDYHPGNLLVDGEDRVTGILDLDWCRMGDPLEDLAYTTMMMMRDYAVDAVRRDALAEASVAYDLPPIDQPRLADLVLLYASFDVHVFATAGPFPGRERFLAFQIDMVEQLALRKEST